MLAKLRRFSEDQSSPLLDGSALLKIAIAVLIGGWILMAIIGAFKEAAYDIRNRIGSWRYFRDFRGLIEGP